MNAHSIKVLEFDRFLELLGGYARSGAGRARLLALRPLPRPEETEADRRLYADALRLRHDGIDLPAAPFEAPADALARAAHEHAVIEPEGFRAVRDLLVTAGDIGRFLLGERCAAATALRELAGALDGCPELCRRIDATFDDAEGHVRDTASEKLRDLRTRSGALERGIRARLEKLLVDTRYADLFQDSFVTSRHGRYVLPVRRELRNEFKGIIHDQSNSGSTLFVEPAEIVEPGNELELLRLDERDEIRRILAALTDELRAHLDRIRDDIETLCRYDAAYAVSAWAREFDACLPASGALRLIGARHPLLQQRLAASGRVGELVPLDVDAPPGRNVVVVTGSNTGGKTVALKTIGLLTLIAQAGLPIPAEAGSVAHWFADVLADIGDEQSIEQNLSTFSAHMEHVVETLTAARERDALVLLDELGAGTDPVEGGALGCAILDTLSGAPGMTFATTHLGAVKRFVHDHPRMENASMLFDVATLRPQYRLLMGRAGASYALAIAERCGLPAPVIEAARGQLSEGDTKLENMLSSLETTQVRMDRDQQALGRARDEAQAAHALAQREHERLERELKELRKERRRILHEAQSEATALVADARREMERLLSEARAAPAREDARALRHRVQEREQTLATDTARTREAPENPLPAAELKAGARVWVASLREHGEITSVGEGATKARVRVGSLNFEIRVAELERPRGAATPARVTAGVRGPPRPRRVPAELNLLGLRADEARSRLAEFLDAAILSQHPAVRIVHGYGTGAIEKVVHEYLDAEGIGRWRLGVSGEDPGGAGVTIVTLA